jgi:type IV pilus assembly protein PilB
MARLFSSGGKHADKTPSAIREGGGVQLADRPPNAGRLGELLVSRRVIDAATVEEALIAQYGSGRRIGDVLIDLGRVTEHDVAAALAAQFELPYIDLRSQAPDTDAATLLDESVAKTFGIAPLGPCSDGSLAVATADVDPDARRQIAGAVARPLTFFVSTPTDIRKALASTYQVLPGVAAQVAAFKATDAGRTRADLAVDDVTADDAPIVQIVSMVLAQAVRERASDVHIEPQDTSVRVRFRVDGSLHDALTLPETMGPGLVSRLKIMAGMNIVERRRPQDGQISTEVEGRAVDLRVATVATIWSEKVVLRILDKTKRLRKLADLGMPADTGPIFSKIVRAPFGMVLCAGPTGSGKTTTLYATLAEINDDDRNVMTIEDPVEYTFPSINQLPINETAGITFATGLKSILRQDPDVILVGEIRDVETARIAVQSALTGHFVLSSLHATDAVAALHRFLDMGIESFLIASSMLGVVGQRLVRRICPECKVPYEPTPDEVAVWAKSGMEPKEAFFHGEGCVFCSHTGYQGRIGVYEVLKVTDEMKSLIVANASHDDLKELAIEQGMITLQDQALRLVERDVTTVAEILRTIYVL